MNDFKLKRKYGDRADGLRVVQREVIQDFFIFKARLMKRNGSRYKFIKPSNSTMIPFKS